MSQVPLFLFSILASFSYFFLLHHYTIYHHHHYYYFTSTTSTATTAATTTTTLDTFAGTVRLSPFYLKPYNTHSRKRRILRPVHTTTMPSFGLIEPVVRRLQPDEEYVVIEFERHASRCPDCIDPLKTFDMGRGLCDRGNQYAVDVNKYIYSLNFKAHSSVDRDCQQPTLLQLSLDCICVHRLLLAIEYGLQLRPKREDIRIQERTPSPVRPVISYDRTYHVAPRMPSASPPSYGHEIVERVSHNNKSRRVIVYPSSSRSSSSTRESRGSRGSLYVEDFAARVDRVRESPRSSGPIEYHR